MLEQSVLFSEVSTNPANAELSFGHGVGRRHFGGGMVSVSIREYKSAEVLIE